ncbi:MAG: hypothetical protein HN813_05545 [Rhodospirillaceae bacterium]|nr:hypothetical protein [Rhodospirillaceae bacterium]
MTFMKKPYLKYIGDKRIRDLLARYDCPVPFHAVRTRLLGNIATPRLDASPVQTIKDLWGGEFPPVDSMDDLNALLQDLMSLWNTLARHQSRTRPFKLAKGGSGSNVGGIEQLCRIRTEEFEGFMEGLYGAEDTIDLPERAVEGMDKLGEINAMFLGALNLATILPTVAATKDDLSATFKNLKMLERAAEKEIHVVILSCKKARAQSMPWDNEPPPTLH